MTVAVMKTKAELALAEQFQAVRGGLPGPLAVRDAGMAAFGALGLPHRRIEEWKYTDLRTALKDTAPPAAENTKVTVADLIVGMGPWMDVDAARIVFVNGRYRKALSNLAGAESVRVVPLSEGFELASETADAVTALNTAFVTDGARVEIPAGVSLEVPLYVIELSASAEARTSTVRHTVQVGAKARATIVELYLTLPGSAQDTLNNTMVQVTVGDGAALTHVKAVSEGARGTHLSNWMVTLGKDSHYRGFQMTAGVALVRNGIGVTYGGEDSKLDLSGVFLGRGSDHIDTTLVVDHAVPGCESRELFAGVLDGRARGIFQGKIIVRPHAQKTDGKQMARVLMLSPDAEFDSKPELEIHADDVVCGHGSTAAEIDADLLFYCRSRGIPEREARAMLVESFIGEAIDKVEHEGLRGVLAKLARQWLAGAAI